MNTLRRISNRLYAPKYHVYTDVLTASVFCLSSEIAIQKLIEKKESLQPRRLMTALATGATMGWGLHYWYRFLDGKFPGSTVAAVFKKVGLEASLSPPVTCTLFAFCGLIDGKSGTEIKDSLAHNFKWLVMIDWGFFMPLQLINFFFVKPKFRVLYVSMVTLFYDFGFIYLLRHDEFGENSSPPSTMNTVRKLHKQEPKWDRHKHKDKQHRHDHPHPHSEFHPPMPDLKEHRHHHHHPTGPMPAN